MLSLTISPAVRATLEPDTEAQGFNVQGNGGALRVYVTPPGVYRVGLFRTDGSEAVKPLGRAWLLANSAFWRVGRALLDPDQFASGDYSSNLPYKLSYTIESQAAAVQARPQDLALRLDEAGKAAKKTKDSTGTCTYARNALGGGSPGS